MPHRFLVSARSLAMSAMLLTVAVPARGQSPESIWREVELADGILGFVTVDDVNPSSYANVLVFFGTDASLVVDTQDRPSAAHRIVDAIRARDLPPVRWVVNTHWHSDHTIGNAVFAAAWPDAEFVAHPVTRDSLRIGGARAIAEQVERNRTMVGRIDAAIESGELAADDVDRYRAAASDRAALADELEAATVHLPTRMVETGASFDLGGRTVRAIHPGPAHTGGDVVIWDADRDFLAAGDLLEDAALWLDGADVAGWAAALERLAALEPARVLPSHGRIRSDAALLEAHRTVLDRAVRVASMEGFGSDASIVAEFSDLETSLEPWGVDPEAFRTYVIEAVRRLRGEPVGG